MAYQSKNLSALGYANGFTLWHYLTDDTAADVLGEGYFSPASRMLRIGDFILLNANAVSLVIVVTANSDGTVAVVHLAAPTADV